MALDLSFNMKQRNLNQSITLKNFARDLGLIILFGCLITLFLSLFLHRSSIWITFSYVQSISLSIFFFTVLSSIIGGKSKSSPIIYVVSTPLGVLIGMGIGALIVGENLLAIQNNLLITIFASAATFGTIVSYYFYSRHKISETRTVLQGENILRLQNERQLIEANLKLLQAQIEPHFLFNTLSTVLGLMDSDVASAKRMLDQLTQYLRITLKRTRQSQSTLGEELNLLQIYLDIQSIRMGKRLKYSIDVPDSLKEAVLPPLLLQPLVENSVKHGLEPNVKGGNIVISAYNSNNMLTLEVTDTGIGFSDNGSSGVGLSNVRARLKSLFGDQSSLNIQNNSPTGVIVSFSIPSTAESLSYE